MTEPRTMKLGIQHRSMPIEALETRQLEDGSTVVRIAISSEYPVRRDFGTEILDHSPTAVDLSRFTNGAPFCVDHDLSDQVGVLENVQLGSDRVLRADVRFSRSQRGQDMMNDVRDGIRKHISVGYAVRKMQQVKKSSEPDTYRVVDWMPIEASTVAIPADPTVGVGRSADSSNATDVVIVSDEEATPIDTTEERGLVVTTAAVTVSESAEIVTLDDSGNVVSDEYTSSTQTTAKTTYETTDEEAADEAAEDPSEEATESPLQEALEELTEPRNATVTVTTNIPLRESSTLELNRMETINVADPITLSAKEIREYRIGEAIANYVEGKRSGLVFEVSDTLAKMLGRDATDGFLIPTSLRTLTSNTSTAGQELVFTQPGAFIDALRPNTVVLGLGAQVIPATQKISYPRQTQTGSAQWAGENGAGISAADFTFDSVTIDPKLLIAQTGFSKKLLQVSSFAVDTIVYNGFTRDFSVALDNAALAGSGSTIPTGVLYASNVNAVSATSGNLPTFAMFVEAETDVLQSNAIGPNMAYVVTPGLGGKLKQTLKNPSGTDASFILAGGEINGYKAVVSSNLPWTSTTSHVALFGDWSRVVIADGGAIDVIVDKYAQSAKGNIVVTGQWLADVAVLQGKAFSKLTQLRTA